METKTDTLKGEDHPLWSPLRARGHVARIVIEADLMLVSPAHFGNGDTDDLVDMPLLVDAATGRPLLTGSSLAGAMRACLQARLMGYAQGGQPANDPDSEKLINQLFGEPASKEGAADSALIVDDAVSDNKPEVEFRAGVEIDAKTGTAKDQRLYFRKVWKSGTCFPIRMELAITEQIQRAGEQEARSVEYEASLLQALAAALEGFTKRQISLGGRRRRGYGEIKVDNWRARRYDLKNLTSRMNWIREGNDGLSQTYAQKDIVRHLAPDENDWLPDRRSFATFNTRLNIPYSLLIRGISTDVDETADDVQLQREILAGTDDTNTGEKNNTEPVISGTSLAGLLRSQALRIARLFNPADASSLVDDLFGHDLLTDHPVETRPRPSASRLFVAESPVKEGELDLLHQRVSIDPFSGGAADAHLFSQRPVFGGYTELQWTVINPKEKEIGLLLQLLKDLWTGHVAIGGNTSGGRGRFAGVSADIEHRAGTSEVRAWCIEHKEEGLSVAWDKKVHPDNDSDDAGEALQFFVNAFVEG